MFCEQSVLSLYCFHSCYRWCSTSINKCWSVILDLTNGSDEHRKLAEFSSLQTGPVWRQAMFTTAGHIYTKECCCQLPLITRNHTASGTSLIFIYCTVKPVYDYNPRGLSNSVRLRQVVGDLMLGHLGNKKNIMGQKIGSVLRQVIVWTGLTVFIWMTQIDTRMGKNLNMGKLLQYTFHDQTLGKPAHGLVSRFHAHTACSLLSQITNATRTHANFNHIAHSLTS